MVASLLVAGMAAFAPPTVDCSMGMTATTNVRATDAQLGPLVVINGNRFKRQRPNGLDRHGYKMPVTLTAGARVTLEVPRALRGKVGLVYRHDVQDAVWERGVSAADTALRFEACAGEGRTGWPGGLAIDRPRCATLVVRQQGQAPVRRRIPLGKRC